VDGQQQVHMVAVSIYKVTRPESAPGMQSHPAGKNIGGGGLVQRTGQLRQTGIFFAGC